jgi:hypothetical protein
MTTNGAHARHNARFLSQSTLDKLFIAQIVLNVIALAFVASLTWGTFQNQRNIQRSELLDARAVARCSTKATVLGLREIAQEIGLHLDLPAPSTRGLDCEEILSTALGGEPVP